jgi:nucleotide-binding universal stress UspA family protein
LISKILVPIDGSEHANKALEWALSLADKHNAGVRIVTVVPILETFTTGTYAKPDICSAPSARAGEEAFKATLIKTTTARAMTVKNANRCFIFHLL